ncbi:protein FON2 SPARE1-like [Prosopis cineraria]|uniref:protein FON2 SPARE1-like n=1 Tax=Prosopis cineraria TaxID=364024 RepID=UPI002410775B|nr:protein FON2 SPARE1-like [Prosopis cineraria]
MNMILRFRHVLVSILWLFLVLIIFRGWLSFAPSNVGVVDYRNDVGATTQLLSALNRNRKLLASKFDFTPFVHRRHHHRRHHHHHRRSHTTAHPPPSEGQIDPRYGVDKRLVPTGPNPLHH